LTHGLELKIGNISFTGTPLQIFWQFFSVYGPKYINPLSKSV